MRRIWFTLPVIYMDGIFQLYLKRKFDSFFSHLKIVGKIDIHLKKMYEICSEPSATYHTCSDYHWMILCESVE